MAANETRSVLAVQSAYYVATGVLPFISRRAFEALTGPKREWWLVQTVGALVTVIGVALGRAAAHGHPQPDLLLVAGGSAGALAGIDLVYVAKGRIAPTYAVDGAIQIALMASLARRTLR